MSTFCNDLVLKFTHSIPENLPQILQAELGPDFKTQDSSIIYGDKTIYFGFRIGNIMELFLTAENGQWTEDEIKKLQNVCTTIGADLNFPTHIARPMIDDQINEREDLIPLPFDIKVIIFGYSLADLSQIVFPKSVVSKAFQIYFKGFYILNHSYTTTIQNNVWQLTLRWDRISIRTNGNCYYCDKELGIIMSDWPYHIVYKDRFMMKNRIGIQVHESNIPKLSPKIIEHFDPRNEFGWMKLFRPLLN